MMNVYMCSLLLCVAFNMMHRGAHETTEVGNVVFEALHATEACKWISESALRSVRCQVTLPRHKVIGTIISTYGCNGVCPRQHDRLC